MPHDMQGFPQAGTPVKSSAADGAVSLDGTLAVAGATSLASTTLTPAVGSSALTIAGATQTTSQPLFSVSQTWNAGAITFVADYANIVDTASAADSMLIRRQVGGVDKFYVTKGGRVLSDFVGYPVAGALTGIYAPSSTFAYIYVNGGAVLQVTASNLLLNLANLSIGASDLTLTRSAAATLQFGAANAASPVAQTLQSQGSRAATDSNVGGANLTVQSGTGTGTGTLSVLNLASPIPVASGTGAQTMATGLQIKGGAAVLTSYVVASLPTGLPAGATAFVTDASTTIILGLGATVVGGGANKVPVYFDGTNWIIG